MVDQSKGKRNSRYTELLFQIDMFTAEKLISYNVERCDRRDSR